MAADDAAVTVSLRADLKGYEAALKSAVRATERAAKAAETAISGVGKNARPNFTSLNDNFQKSAGQIANDARVMQFQLNDIFSGLASGQGIRAVQQQLGQIAQQMTGQTLRQGVATMGTALVGMINPINLAVVAFGLAASAAASYFFGSEDSAKKSKKAFEEHADAIAALREAYGKAAEGAEEFAARSQVLALGLAVIDKSVLELQRKILTSEFFKGGGEGFDLTNMLTVDTTAVALKVRDLQSIIQTEWNKKLQGLSFDQAAIDDAAAQIKLLGTLPGQIVGGFAKLNEEMAIFQPALNALAESAKDGTADFVAFQEAIAKIALGNVTDEQRKFGQELIKGAEAAAKNERALEGVTKAVNSLADNLKLLGAAFNVAFGVDIVALIDAVIQKLGGLDNVLHNITGVLGDFGNFVSTTWNEVGASIQSASDLIKKFEGFITHAKLDTGRIRKFRVGFGSDTFVDEMGKVQKVTKDTVVTLEQANRDLERRIGEFQGTIVRQIGPDLWRNLQEGQQAALTSIAYNYGSLPNSIIKALKAGDMGRVATAIAALGSDNAGINAKRRQQEAELFARGSFAAETTLKEADATRKANENLQEYLRSLDEQASLQTRINEINTTSTLNADQKRIAIEVETELQKALNQARQDGITLTDADIAKIREKAIANAQAGNAAIAISEAEAAAAKAAADATAKAKKEAEDQAQALKNLANTLAGMATGALTGFVQDLRNGTDAAEALYNAVSRIADQLLQMALNMMFQQLFKSMLGGLSGVPLMGMAGGGYTGDRSTGAPAGIVHGREFVVNAAATRKHRDLLEAINKGVPGYASGGFVLPNLSRMAQQMPALQSASQPQVNTRTTVVNTFDSGSFLSEALSRPDGVNVILNAVRAQPGAFRQAMNG